MAADLLAALGEDNVIRTQAHDLESFLWVLLYIVYQKAAGESQCTDTTLRDEISGTFKAFFLGRSVAKLREQRQMYIAGSAHPALLQYAHERSRPKENLAALVATVILRLREATRRPCELYRYSNPHDPSDDHLPLPLKYDVVLSVLDCFWNTDYV